MCVTTYSRVIVAKNDLYVKNATFVDTDLRTWYDGRPVEEVVVGWSEFDGTEVLLHEVGNLAVYAFESGLTHIIRDDGGRASKRAIAYGSRV